MTDFDKIIPRRNSGSYKWDAIPGEALPLWVADMDFEVAPAIKRALAQRVEHGIFGYTQVDEDYYRAVISWFERRHHWRIEREEMMYTSGVVPAISCSIKALTLPGEKVLVLTPVYNCFFSCIQNQGCQVAESRLVRVGNKYQIDWDDFEAQCSDAKTTVFLLCNPHNPGGRVWSREELRRMGEVCARHGVRVISDEIHCELVMPGYTFTPFAAVNAVNKSICVALNSPSKSFNTAGLQIANIICADADLRRRIDRVVIFFEVCAVNPFGPVALKAAYNESEAWLDELCQYIAGNFLALKQHFADHLPEARVMELEGTYLAWVDIAATGLGSDDATERLLSEGKVFVSSGTGYGREAGEGFIRINMACPRTTLMQGLERITKVLSDASHSGK